MHHLIRSGFKVAKPSFDTDGADLLIVDDINAKFTKTIKVQCKGRTLITSARVEISKSYVTKNFVLFLYLKTDKEKDPLYYFTSEDFIQWDEQNDKYILNITKSSLDKEQLQDREYTKESASKIKGILQKSEIKKYSSLIIEENFIREAIDKTLEIYKEIYPERTFKRPSINDAIRSIASVYDNFYNPEIPVRCQVFVSEEKSNRSFSHHFGKVYTDQNIELKIYREVVNRDASVEILEFLERVINTENIMLAADDFIYEEPLNKLKNKGVDIRIIQFSSSEGRQIYSEHMWGDVIYAIAHALGLKKYEW